MDLSWGWHGSVMGWHGYLMSLAFWQTRGGSGQIRSSVMFRLDLREETQAILHVSPYLTD